MERILENIERRSFGLSSHPSTGLAREGRGRASRGECKNWAGSWSRKNARAGDAP